MDSTGTLGRRPPRLWRTPILRFRWKALNGMEYESVVSPKALQWGALPGHCYIVPTPLGNLGDLSYRAAIILNTVDSIACEDTRVTHKLLQAFSIQKSCTSYRDDNERIVAPKLLEKLQSGQSLAIVSDAGTPTISDPGYRLIKACRENGIPVIPLPGPCAVTTALSASGLPTDHFLFTGFLPPKTHGRSEWFRQYADFPHTLVAYESCHRLIDCLNDALKILGPNRSFVVAKELTKQHEAFYHGPLESVLKQIEATHPKGEYVLMIGPMRTSFESI
jgi:16S rRNA (cytidine1402-2'-O)-methyltransferase